MEIVRRLKAAQRRQFVKIIWVLADLVSFQKRSYSQAIDMINAQGLHAGSFLKQKDNNFVGHIFRFDIGDRETHLVKYLIL